MSLLQYYSVISKTFTVKYYDRRIWTNTVSIIIIRRRTHIKRDSERNGNEKDSSEKLLERKSQKLNNEKKN